jgi:hypothetical protein
MLNLTVLQSPPLPYCPLKLVFGHILGACAALPGFPSPSTSCQISFLKEEKLEKSLL